jgi:MFS transporter, SP family, sugar:H+ symporter
MPESPRWLLCKGYRDEALQALERIAGSKNKEKKIFIESEFKDMELRLRQAQSLGNATLLDAFNPKGKVLYRTILGIMLQSLQQLTGANYFFYYGASIFKSVGINNAYVTQIILGGVNVLCTLPGLWFVERFGRRDPLILGGLWQFGWLVVFAAVGSELDSSKRGTGGVLIAAACMFIAGYSPHALHLMQFCLFMGSRSLGRDG